MATKRARMGRPPLDPKERRDATVLVRLNATELARLQTLAKRWGVSDPEALRRCLDETHKRKRR